MNKVTRFPVRVVRDGDKWAKKPAIPAGENWQTYIATDEEIEGAEAIGCVVPEGVVVLDLDEYKGVTTADADKALGVELDWSAAAIQRTISGGMHYAFRLPEGVTVRQGQNVVGLKGLDTRAAGKGWIATGKGYTDLTNFGLIDALEDSEWLPELPSDAIEKLNGKNGAARNESNRDLDELAIMVANRTAGYGIDQLRELLARVPDTAAEDGESWMRVGMGIYHETGGSEEGWKLFDEFSKRAGNYNERMNRRRWDSWGSNTENPVTIGSVIAAAGGNAAIRDIAANRLREDVDGCDSTGDINDVIQKIAVARLGGVELDALLKSIQKKYKVLTGEAPGLPALRKAVKVAGRDARGGGYAEHYVFVTSSGEYVNKETKAAMGPRAFNVKHTRHTPPNADGESQTAEAYVMNSIECVDLLMYAPKFGLVFEREGLSYMNTYKPCDINVVPQGTTDIVDRVKGHIAHLLEDEREQQIAINYLAHNVQRPGEKIPWMIVLQGVQGDGKSLLAELMQHVMGFSNVRMLNVQQLESSFTGWAAGQCMTFIEELKLDNIRKYEVLNNLKPYITNPTVECTKKGVDPQTVLNTTNYFALTNFRDALPIDDHDRRYCVLFSRWQQKDALEKFMDNNPNYYPNLYADMREHPGELLDWLLNHEIPKEFFDMTRAPATKAKEEMQRLTKSDAWLIVEDAISEFECHDINNHVVNVTKLSGRATDGFSEGYKDFPRTRALRNVLLDMGYHPIGTYKESVGDTRKNQVMYCKDDKAKPTDFKNEDDFDAF